MRSLISLVGIYKNESASIARVIESARAAMVDHATLLDTGSTDETLQIIRDNFAKWGDLEDHHAFREPAVPFREIPSAPIDFAATRNLVLDREASREDAALFTLMLSGDEEIVETEPGALRRFLEQHRETSNDAFCVTMRSDVRQNSWLSPRVLRVDGGRRYKYPIHEVPIGAKGERDAEVIPGVVVKYKEGDQARMFGRLTNVDLPILEYMAAQDPGEDHDKHLERARAILYLAQTHHNLAAYYKKEDVASKWRFHMMAAMAYYTSRADLEGDPIDQNFSLFHVFNIGFQTDIYSHAEMLQRLEGLAQIDPHRPEVRYRLAFHASQLGDPRRAAALALQAEDVAREALKNPPSYPTDAARCLWLSIQIQAECAELLKMPELMKRTAQKGLDAGGPREAFANFLEQTA